MKIGLISDTHGYVDPLVHDLLAGVDHILHAGDIGPATIIAELERIAPVTAVLGNNDWDETFRETEVLELAGRKFLIHHIVDPHHPCDKVRRLIERHRPDVVMFGHTHKPFDEVVNGVRFINPGYAGKPRFGMVRTLAKLTMDGQLMHLRNLPLDAVRAT